MIDKNQYGILSCVQSRNDMEWEALRPCESFFSFKEREVHAKEEHTMSFTRELSGNMIHSRTEDTLEMD